MPTPEHPRLRASIDGQPDAQDPQFVFLFDTARVSRHVLRLHRDAVALLQLFNGTRSLRDMQALLLQHGVGVVPVEVFQHMADTLDEACFLEGPRLEAKFAEYLERPVREPACIGSYEAEPEALNQQLRSLFVHERGPGSPPTNGHVPDGHVRGALI